MSSVKKLPVVITLLFVLAAGAGVTVAVQQLRKPVRETPTTRVRRGDLDLKVYTTGELRAARIALLVAPPIGGSLQIVELAPTGKRVKAGDLVIQFNPGEQE